MAGDAQSKLLNIGRLWFKFLAVEIAGIGISFKATWEDKNVLQNVG